MKALFAIIALSCGAHNLIADDAVRRWHPYDRGFDARVLVQGMGWGLGAKGLGIRVVMPSGTPVYFDSPSVEQMRRFEQWQGMLIEVSGVLRKRVMHAAPEGTQGYSVDFEYLALEDYEIRGIEKVTSEFQTKTEQDGAHQPATRRELKGK